MLPLLNAFVLLFDAVEDLFWWEENKEVKTKNTQTQRRVFVWFLAVLLMQANVSDIYLH